MRNFAYSTIQHLAHALFPQQDHSQHYFSMSYTAYFDASGTRSRGKVLVVGGFLATVNAWDAFNTHWMKILDKYEVDEFHMTDFVHGYGRFKEEKWKRNDGYSENFLRKLVNAICLKVKYAPTVLIYLDDWRALNEEFMLKENDLSPFALAGSSCTTMVYDWCLRHRVPLDQLQVFFERGDLDKGDLIDFIRSDLGILLPPFQSKQICALQACDLLAWEAANAELSLISGVLDELRLSIREILDRVPCDPLTFNGDGMRKICLSKNIPRR